MTEKEIFEKIKKSSHYNAIEKRDEALKLLIEAKNDSKKINYRSGVLNCNEGLMTMYVFKHDYKKVIEIAKESEKILISTQDVERLAQVYMNMGIAYLGLGFMDEALADLKKSVKYNNKSKNNDIKHDQLSNVYQNMASYYENKQKPDSIIYFLKKSIEESKQMNDSSKLYGASKYNNIIFTNLNIASYYTGVSKPQRLDLAEEYFNEVLKYKDTENFKANSVIFYNNFARFYNEKKDYKKAVEYATIALSKIMKAQRASQKQITYETLYKAYDKLGNKEMKIKYLELYTQLSDSLRSLEKSSINYSNTQIIEENKKNFKEDQKKTWMMIAVIIIILIIIFGIIWWKHIKKTKARYETIIKNFKKNEDIPVLAESADNKEDQTEEKLIDADKNKNLDIPEASIQSILTYLDAFEKTYEFTKADVSLSYLANYANTNTKYLNEVLKNYKGKSFSKYINGLRINYIMKLLYNEPKYREYKITYLAELCGFSSRQVFTTVFKKETDITTSYYINQLKNESLVPGENPDL
jgi:AraC-like DNA-binding protein